VAFTSLIAFSTSGQGGKEKGGEIVKLRRSVKTFGEEGEEGKLNLAEDFNSNFSLGRGKKKEGRKMRGSLLNHSRRGREMRLESPVLYISRFAERELKEPIALDRGGILHL